MDIDSCIINPIPNQGTKRLSQDVLSHQQLFGVGSRHQVPDGQLQTNWPFSPFDVNRLTTSKFEENFRNEMNFDWRKQRSDYVSGIGSPLLQGTLKGMSPYQLQNLMHYPRYDDCASYGASSFYEAPFSPIWARRTGLDVSPGFYNPNMSILNASGAGKSMPDSRYFQQSRNTYQDTYSLVASGGKNLPCLVDEKQIPGEVVSPEQISSVTACSDADWYSDKETYEDGVTFAATPFAEPKLGFSPPAIPRDTNTLSSEIFAEPKLIDRRLSQHQIQMVRSNQSNQQPCPPPSHLDIPRVTQLYGCSAGQNFYNEVAGERSSKLSLLSEQLQGFQQPSFCNLQDLEPATIHKILSLYLKYKSKLLDACQSQNDFMDLLHMTVCSGLKCNCEGSLPLIYHFDNCNSGECAICGPFHQFSLIEKIKLGHYSEACFMRKTTSESGKQKEEYSVGLNHRNYSTDDPQPTPKRIKMDNAVPSDNWSLGAIALSFRLPVETNHQQSGQFFGRPTDQEQNSARMNEELFSCKETPKSLVTGNNTADCGATCTNVCSKKTEGNLCLGQSSDGPISGAFLNKEMPISMVNLAKNHLTASDDERLGNDGTSFRSELPNLVDKQLQCVSSEVKGDGTFNDGMLDFPEEPPVDQDEKIKLISEGEGGRIDANSDSTISTSVLSGTKLERLKGLGVSLTDFFTAEQIKEHLHSLSHDIKPNAEEDVTGNTNIQAVSENTCQLCAVDRLTFTAPPMYCTSCGARIKRGLTYYWTLDELGGQCCFCTLCFKESRGGNISFRGLSFSKAKLQKGKNTEESEEGWVQCDKCEHWQHQICALYNSKRDLEGKGNYICPFCQLSEIAANEDVVHPPLFGARDLPRTKLSDHIEKRLYWSLDRERTERAKLLGKSPEEVPGAADLVVRVVLAVDKQLKVKQQFLNILHGENYPSEFPYRSKVILLFQKVEGVDVCLFAMYVQEFGSECGQPNQRSVYISYLDSVKYFRPEIRTAAGMALRTFVYHEILTGYLDYCKQRGFTTCYIWACPPLRGEDYILYCHPETQKTPKPDKLRHWYKLMLKTALEENVVVEHTNFYDYFFVPSGACNSKVTAARLPYFDGDYWSGAIEDMLRAIEKNNGGESERKMKKQMSKRTLKAMGHSDPSVDATKDILVMQKLGHTILPVKEDFIVVHLQFTCVNCHEAILSGSRWSCDLCSNFHLCSRCLEVKQADGLETHTNIRGERHQLHQIPVNDVAADTEDNDVILDNDFFENRHAFLNFCQKNHYQFDTLRRAKHSSMMILYHLHKTTALTMGTHCSICRQDATMGWHCETCSEFYICSACYQKDGDSCHNHKLVQRSVETAPRTKVKKVQHERALQVSGLLDLLQHANHCEATRDKPCSYPKCPHVKILFFHSRGCKIRAQGGCVDCNKIWYLVHLHARHCTDSNCGFPRCQEVKYRKEMLKTQSECLRRAAITEQLSCKRQKISV